MKTRVIEVAHSAGTTTGPPSFEEILQETADRFGLDRRALLGDSRARKVSLARQVVMYLSRRLTYMTLKDIADAFERDHTTVIYANRKIEDLVRIGDPETAGPVVSLEREIRKRHTEPSWSMEIVDSPGDEPEVRVRYQRADGSTWSWTDAMQRR